MRAFWTLFFLGSMLLVGLDVRERRETPSRVVAPPQPFASDPMPFPTPKDL